MRGHREGQTDIHAARVAFHRRIEELLDLRESHDLVELSAHFAVPHAEDHTIEKDVLAPGELGMETCPHLEETGRPAGELEEPRGWPGDPGEKFQQRRFSGA